MLLMTPHTADTTNHQSPRQCIIFTTPYHSFVRLRITWSAVVLIVGFPKAKRGECVGVDSPPVTAH